MNFLAPLFLLGALAVGLPVVFHLIRRTTRERTVFSSLMFLLPTPPRLTRRSRLEHLLLLALRCLVLCLLAFGFARPFLQRAVTPDPPSATARRLVLLVDTSASMRRSGLWSEARSRAEALLRRAHPADEVCVLTFGRQVESLVSFAEWSAAPTSERPALALGRLAGTQPGWSSTRLGQALVRAAETLADTGGKEAIGSRQIVLLSDLQEGSRLEALQAYEWPKGITLSVEALQPKRAGNASLQLVTDTDDAERKARPAVRVRVGNAADSTREQFKVGWADRVGSAEADGRSFVGEPVDVYVPAGQSRIVAVPLPPGDTKADRLVLRGDDEDFDNTVFVVPPETVRSSVLYFGSDLAQDARQPLYFLQRAFQETRRQAVQVVVPASAAPLAATNSQAAALLVVTDPLPAERTQELRDLVTRGKTLLAVVKSEALASTLARLLDRPDFAVTEARPDRYAMLAEIDFQHPLFAPFADPRFSDFTKIHFWKYRRVDATQLPGARVLAKFDTGDPALVELAVGKGRVLLLAAGWQPEDSQLALSTKFVPFLYALLDLSGAAPPAPEQFLVGDTVRLASLPQATAVATTTLRLPDGSQFAWPAGQTNFTQTLTPGIYTVTSAQPARSFAVNLDPAESRVAPLPADELERLGAPVPEPTPSVAGVTGRSVRLQSAELEGRQKLWRWCILATLVILLAESWLAGRTARRSVQPSEATS